MKWPRKLIPSLRSGVTRIKVRNETLHPFSYLYRWHKIHLLKNGDFGVRPWRGGTTTWAYTGNVAVCMAYIDERIKTVKGNLV